MLNVMTRADVRFLDSHLRALQRPHVWRLALPPGALPHQRKSFADFLQSMADKQRMGVVSLPPARKMYLVPPSASVVERLQVSCILRPAQPSSVRFDSAAMFCPCMRAPVLA